jgi:acetolactate synthase small subunit
VAFTGTPAKLDTILALIRHFGILDIVKSGIAVMRKHEENGITDAV